MIMTMNMTGMMMIMVGRKQKNLNYKNDNL